MRKSVRPKVSAKPEPAKLVETNATQAEADEKKRASPGEIPMRPKIHTPELLKAYRIVADLKELPPDADAKVCDAWKFKESDLKGFHQSLRQQEDAFSKRWDDEKSRLDELRARMRQEERAAEARNLEAESAARRGAPPAELADAAGPTLALIDRVLGEYAT